MSAGVLPGGDLSTGVRRESLLSVLGRYLGLIYYKTYADLRTESTKTFAGFLWWIIEPLISLVVYYTVFELVLNRGMVDNYAVFLFVGLVPWRWMQSSVMHGAHALRSARGLMQQVYLPKLVFPIVTMLADTLKFAIVFVILILVTLLFGGAPLGMPYLSLPIVLLVQGLFIAGIGLIIAAITPFFPDLFQILENLLRLWFFLSCVFYPVSILGERAQFYFQFNPMVPIIDAYRAVLLRGEWPDISMLLIIAVPSSVAVAIGVFLLRKFDFAYPKVSFT